MARIGYLLNIKNIKIKRKRGEGGVQHPELGKGRGKGWGYFLVILGIWESEC